MQTVTANGCRVMPCVSMNTPISMAKGKNPIAGVVLCGGQSSRMGTDKSTLLFNKLPLLEHMRRLLQTTGINRVISAGSNKNHTAASEVIADIIPGRGPLSGIHAVLTQLQETFTHVLIVPVDMPLLTRELLQQLINTESDTEACYFAGFVMPLKLAITSNIKNTLTARLDQDDNKKSSLKSFLSELRTRTLPLAESMKPYFDNSNTPEDWQRMTRSIP